MRACRCTSAMRKRPRTAPMRRCTPRTPKGRKEPLSAALCAAGRNARPDPGLVLGAPFGAICIILLGALQVRIHRVRRAFGVAGGDALEDVPVLGQRLAPGGNGGLSDQIETLQQIEYDFAQ